MPDVSPGICANHYVEFYTFPKGAANILTRDEWIDRDKTRDKNAGYRNRYRFIPSPY